MKMLMKILNKNISKQACCIDLRNSDLFHRTRSKCTANIHETLTAVLPLRCATGQLRSTNRQSAQCCLVVAHFQHSKFNTVYMDIYIYRIAPLTLGTLHWSCAYVVAQLHALSAQQNKHLLSVEFS